MWMERTNLSVFAQKVRALRDTALDFTQWFDFAGKPDPNDSDRSEIWKTPQSLDPQFEGPDSSAGFFKSRTDSIE
jgi:hypothetical protein